MTAPAPPAPTPPPPPPPHHQPAHHLTARLLQALDNDYNVVDMRAIDEVISVLENINITKELLEATRLGKHVNELRRRTDDAALARRTKLLVKRWRDLVIPEKAGAKPTAQLTSADITPRQSPHSNRGISPAVTPSVTPRLSSPQVPAHNVSNTVHKQDNNKHLPNFKRQPLTSPALHNLSPGLRNSHPLRNSSPSFKNLTTGQKIISPINKSMSPSLKTISPGLRNLNTSVTVVSPALRKSETVWNVTPSKDPYDSDSQDVIFVDDTVDDTRTLGNNSNSLNFRDQPNISSNKRPRSPVNGGVDEPILADELRREAKKARRESGGRKAKKRRNHTKSENRTTDHSLDPISVGSPFLPISSASTSPALSTSSTIRNGLKVPTPPVVSVIIDDLDSRSSTSTSDTKSKSSRKNGCKKPIEVDDYSNFIKSKISTGGRKVKTTKELLEEMQARKSGKIPESLSSEKKRPPKEDFLTKYDSKKNLKKETPVVTDIIELNDSNSSSKMDEPSGSASDVKDKKEIKMETDDKSESGDKPVKFEPVEVILARLPPIEVNWDDEDYDNICTCTMIYTTPEVEDKIEATLDSKKSIFELDNNSAIQDSVTVPVVQSYEEKIDVNCPASKHRKFTDVNDRQIQALHNQYIADVNGSKCESDHKSKPQLACRMNSWGLRPYYDCSRDLFHNVVPKYNYLDYSSDRCVKNLSNVPMEKYEPAEATLDTSDWYLNLENEFFERWKAKNESLVCDEFDSAADSPFSEKREDQNEDETTTEGLNFDSDNKTFSDSDKVNLDKNESSSKDPEKETDDKEDVSAEDDKKENKEPDKILKEFELCDFYNFTGYGLITNSYFSKRPFPQELLEDDVVENTKPIQVQEQNIAPVETVEPVTVENTDNYSNKPSTTYIPRTVKKFTYEDSISLLPLSLSALNAAAVYGCNIETSGDLSCLFRTKCVTDETHQDDDLPCKETCDLSYSLVQNANILDMKDVSSTVKKRTSNVFLSDHDEDANCGSDVKNVDIKDRSTTNSGAFESDSAVVEELSCVKNGCPSWIPGSTPPDAFREWHEPVQRTSHNGDLLTILPYVVID